MTKWERRWEKRTFVSKRCDKKGQKYIHSEEMGEGGPRWWCSVEKYCQKVAALIFFFSQSDLLISKDEYQIFSYIDSVLFEVVLSPQFRDQQRLDQRIPVAILQFRCRLPKVHPAIKTDEYAVICRGAGNIFFPSIWHENSILSCHREWLQANERSSENPQQAKETRCRMSSWSLLDTLPNRSTSSHSGSNHFLQTNGRGHPIPFELSLCRPKHQSLTS